MKNWNPATISLPNDLLDQVDSLRHDISRSKWIQRCVQRSIDEMNMAVAVGITK
jgi:metal-responsive CopG/Arc/MetJ family transcriptional regulator